MFLYAICFSGTQECGTANIFTKRNEELEASKITSAAQKVLNDAVAYRLSSNS